MTIWKFEKDDPLTHSLTPWNHKIIAHLKMGNDKSIILFHSKLHSADMMQGHQQFSGKSDENKSFQPNQIVPSIHIMIELCYFSLDQWEMKIHMLWGKCFISIFLIALVKKPLDQCEIARHWRAFLIQDKSRHGLVKMTYSQDNCWCPCYEHDVKTLKIKGMLQSATAWQQWKWTINQQEIYINHMRKWW